MYLFIVMICRNARLLHQLVYLELVLTILLQSHILTKFKGNLRHYW